MSEEELIETLRAFEKNRVEQLEEPAKNLFYAIIKIADERDRLNNIIKEVREYIKDKWEMELKDSMEDFLDHDELIDRKRLLHILEILDKENKQ